MLTTHYSITVCGIVYGYDIAHALTTLDTTYRQLRLYSCSVVYNKNDIDDMITALKNDIINRYKVQCHGVISHYRIHITEF